MHIRHVRCSAILLLLISGVAVSQSRDSRNFWRDLIKGPLSGPLAEKNLIDNHKDALIPGQAGPEYLEGSVISVVPGSANIRKVVLSMEGNDVADATLVFDGDSWILRTEPQKGTVVRFTGVIRGFTKEPFMVTLEPEQVSGLDIETTEPNRPFRFR